MARGARRRPFASAVAYDRQAGAGEADASGFGTFGRLFGLLVCPAAYLATPDRLARAYARVAIAYVAVSAVGSRLAENPVGVLVRPS